MKLEEFLKNKHQQILESPYLHVGAYRDSVGKSEVSTNTLKRAFDLLGFFEINFAGDNDFIEFYMRKEAPQVLGVIQRDEKVEIIFSLRFKDRVTVNADINEFLNGRPMLQIASAYVSEKFKYFGIASFAYAQLVKHGYVVISDSEQFTDGAELWKKMVRKAELANYKIYILDTDYGLLKANGTPVIYDGSNIDDAKIWSSEDDYSGCNILLVMK